MTPLHRNSPFFPKRFLARFADVRGGVTLHRRLFLFLALLLLIVLSSVLLILYTTGVFSSGFSESRVFFDSELAHLSSKIATESGEVTVSGLSLSERLSSRLETAMDKSDISFSQLQKHPEFIEPLLDEATDSLIDELEKNRTSLVFVALDVTINPDIPDADRSRAGLLLRNLSPNIVSNNTPTTRFEIGPAQIARERHLYVLNNWRLEIPTAPEDYFQITKTSAMEDLPLSRLYYWNPGDRALLADEDAMLLCVPLIDSGGRFMGVCGLGISASLFKLAYMPDDSMFPHTFAVFAPRTGNEIDLSKALFSGNYNVRSEFEGNLVIGKEFKELTTFSDASGKVFEGLCKDIVIYPKDAVHQTDWIFIVAAPQEEVTAYNAMGNRTVIFLLVLLLAAGIIAAVFVSRRYITPIANAIDRMKQTDSRSGEKYNIREIDDLFTFLAERDDPKPAALDAVALNANRNEIASGHDERFDTFVKNVNSLSRAERAIFNLYVEGYTAREIIQILHISINTIKTHNKHIYTKLGVTSRKELLDFVARMDKEAPKES
ncbi:MAG: LuxR C-terminal-related transcriptional regulator [Clostridiales Family XIII bacterium]|jgi:DNA-binding CsgD family transcriptional regulator|nr:LuxR C-terminal-related transcriptional regulator [Clostridiales Family XIII bacterium]